MNKPKVAVIGTGGTIASIGKNPLDIVDYGANKTMIGIEESDSPNGVTWS